MDRRLQAVTMVTIEESQELQNLRDARELAPQVWSIEWEILHEESPEGQQLFTRYGEIHDGFIKLKFYKNDQLKFDNIVCMHKGYPVGSVFGFMNSSFSEEVKSFAEKISESPSGRAMMLCGMSYPEDMGYDNRFGETYFIYFNGVLSLNFEESAPPPEIAVPGGTCDEYPMIMPRSRAIETFSSIARDVQAYIDEKA